jgi:hypothetical protein
MQCESIREQLTGHVTQGAQALPPSVIEHLATCQSCREEAEDLAAIWGGLKAIPVALPGGDARARFDLMVEAYRQGQGQSVSRSRSVSSWIGSWWPRQHAVQLGFGLALLLMGVFLGAQLRWAPSASDLEQSHEIAALRGELSGMKQMVALTLMQHQSATDRLRGVNWSYELGQPGQEVLTALIDTLTYDPSVNVRLATVDALRPYGDRPIVRQGVVDAMARQDNPMVQVALIDFAVDVGERASIQTLQQLTEDQQIDSAVRERALKGLAQLK